MKQIQIKLTSWARPAAGKRTAACVPLSGSVRAYRVTNTAAGVVQGEETGSGLDAPADNYRPKQLPATEPVSRRRHAVAWIVGVAALALDQLTKTFFGSWSCANLICPLRNNELMLGLVGGTTTQVLAASIIGLALFWLWLRAASQRARIPVAATALVVSGSVGNLLDRVFLGSVRDFLAFPANTVVNVADVALATGLLAVTASLIAGMTERSPRSATNRSTSPRGGGRTRRARKRGRPCPRGSRAG